MKITKRQLRRIIKEERARVIREQAGQRMAVSEDLERLLPDSTEAYKIQDLAQSHGVIIEVRTVGSKEALIAFYDDLQAGGESMNLEDLISAMQPA
jgi:hypothetical protein